MKRFYVFLLYLICCISINFFYIPSVSYAEGQALSLYYDGVVYQYTGKVYNLKMDGEDVPTDVPVVIINDRSMVPVRAVCEKMGAKVDWDDNEKKALISFNKTNIELKINDKNAKVNDKIVELDTPAKVVNHKTLVPLRFISEQLNMKVGWFPDQNLITIDHSRIEKIEMSNANSKDSVAVSLDFYKNSNVFKLSNPDRLVIDFPNVNISDKLLKNDFSGNAVKSMRYAAFEDSNTGYKAARIVLDTNGAPDYQVEEKDGKLTLFVASPVAAGGNTGSVQTPAPPATVPVIPPATPPTDAQTLNVSQRRDGPRNEVSIALGNYSGYSIQRYTDTDRIVIDIPSSGIKIKKDQLNVDQGLIKTIRYAQFNESTIRVVLDVVGQPMYSTDERSGKLVVYLDSPTYKNMEYHNNADGAYVSLNGVKLAPQSKGGTPACTIQYDSTGKISTFTFANSGADFGSGTLMINDGLFESVNIKSDSATRKTTVVLTAKSKFSYDVSQGLTTNSTIFNVMQPLDKSINYKKNGDRIVFLLPGASLTDGGSDTTRYYTETYDSTGKKYSITFPSTVAFFSPGVLPLNDSYFESVRVEKSIAKKETTITFEAKDKFAYIIMKRPITGDTAITVVKPAAGNEKIVVIDAGHGGPEEPGKYVTDDFIEKDLNLDISQRLNALLKKKNIRTYMIREEDSYVWFVERAQIANKLNASLYMSVHNNAYYPNARGTETLYYPGDSNKKNGVTGMRFAQIVQESLLKGLNTINRKAQAHPEFVVLNSTDMPSVIAEIAFMTNKDDASYLKKPEFRQAAAESLCDAIVKTLGEMK